MLPSGIDGASAPDPNSHTRVNALLPERYERLRSAAMHGDRGVEGLSVIAFHGLWQGLWVLARQADIALTRAPAAPEQPASTPHTGTHDRQLVRLLANMVLATQSRECHVY